MIDIINIALAVLTIAFGAFGFLAPRYTAGALDLEPGKTTMGLSELRAGSGGLFVAMGAWCLIDIQNPIPFFALGVAYLGAGAGRVLSLIFDAPPRRKVLLFLAFEWPPAAWLILANPL